MRYVFKSYTATLTSLLVGIIVFSGCAFFVAKTVQKSNGPLYPVAVSDYPEFLDDMAYDSLDYAVSQSISYLKRLPASTEFTFGKQTVNAEHMIQSLETFIGFIKSSPDHQDLKAFIRQNYDIYKSVGSGENHQVLFTGYYEPILQGSLHPSNRYRFPIYPRPSDLSVIDLSLFSSQLKGKQIIGRYTNPEFIPYYDRKYIESNGLSNNALRPIAWVDDKVDLFFLQIQGSGKIYLDSGRIINVHYHISNGRPYRSIGNYLISQGDISLEDMSMQKIKEYLHKHPEEMDTILNYNPSYVFFKLEEDGPYGALAAKLTPGRSIALDRDVFPCAGLAFIETSIPVIDGDDTIQEWTRISRFVVNQDTGGAIQGPGRADLFWGNGSYAEVAAGHMKQPGNLYFLILKQ